MSEKASASVPVYTGIADLTAAGLSIASANAESMERYTPARLLLRRDSVPVGWLDICPAELGPDTFPLKPSRNDVTSVPLEQLDVAICTRDRPDQLNRCLRQLMTFASPKAEVIVVDNAPVDNRTYLVVNSLQKIWPSIRYVMEPRPGLSCARNRALRESTNVYLAFTDDDVVVDSYWLSGVAIGFGQDKATGAVTGMVPPAELRTEAQRGFDQQLERWTYDITPEVYSLRSRRSYGFVFPYSAGHIGAGANLAVRRQVVIDAGGFDEALGAGRLTGAGEDNEILVRLLRRGWTVAYEPGAIVWHYHRESSAALVKQLAEHAAGTSAFLTRTFLEPGKSHFLKSSLQGGYSLIRSKYQTRIQASDGSYFAQGDSSTKLLGREAAWFAVGPALYCIERIRLWLEHHGHNLGR